MCLRYRRVATRRVIDRDGRGEQEALRGSAVRHQTTSRVGVGVERVRPSPDGGIVGADRAGFTPGQREGTVEHVVEVVGQLVERFEHVVLDAREPDRLELLPYVGIRETG